MVAITHTLLIESYAVKALGLPLYVFAFRTDDGGLTSMHLSLN